MGYRKALLSIALTALAVAPGCGSSGFMSGGGAGKADPAHVLAEFLEAVRTGDDEKVASLLTPLARQKTAEMEMVVAPPGSETARFEVGTVELEGSEAYVASDWTDLDADGRLHTDRIVWIMRQESEGWRIFGMATKVFADQEPIELNFEDPAEMVRQQQKADEELARRDREQFERAKSQTKESAGIAR